MNTLYFCQHNHGNNRQTEDFKKTFGGMFENINVQFTKELKSEEKNLILDEFSQFKFIDEIKKIKKNSKSTKYYLIFTEYIYNNQTFNQFGKNSFFTDFKILIYKIIYSTSLSLFFFEKKINLKISSNNKLTKKISHLLRFLWNSSGNFIRTIYKIFLGDSLYMYYRYRGFKEIEKYIDCYLIWNDNQKYQLEKNLNKKINVIYFLPELKKIKKKNKTGISISGFKSRYRSNLIKKLKKSIHYENNFEDFLESKKFLFKEKFYTYSINPGRNYNWPFPSLIRYAFSINNSEIPVVVDKYEDKFANYSSLYVSLENIKNNSIFNEKNIEKNIELINNKIELYQEIYKESKTQFEKLVNEKY